MAELDIKPRVAVIGATGLVGGAIIELLAANGWRPEDVVALASAKSVGKRVDFGDTGIWVDDLEDFDFSTVSQVYLAVPYEQSELLAAQAQSYDCGVVNCHCNTDAEGAARFIPTPRSLGALDRDNLQLPHPIALATSMLIERVQALAPIEQLKVTAMQPVSAYGRAGTKALASEAVNLLSGKPPETKGFGCQLAFNIIPGGVSSDGDCQIDERMLESQIRFLCDEPVLPVTVGLATVPVFYGTTCHLDIEISQSVDVDRLQTALAEDDWFRLSDQPTPVTEGVGEYQIVVGNVRKDDQTGCRLSMWIVLDNVKTGAARTAFALGEVLQKNFQ